MSGIFEIVQPRDDWFDFTDDLGIEFQRLFDTLTRLVSLSHPRLRFAGQTQQPLGVPHDGYP